MNIHLAELIERYPLLKDCAGDIERVFRVMEECFRSGGKVLLCGNGGSAADAEHWAGELMKGFRRARRIPDELRRGLRPELADNLQGALPAIPLTGFISLGSAYANDVDPDFAFAQMVWGLGREGDVLVGISTSGNARNVNYALETASALGMKTVGLTGRDGGRMSGIADVCVMVPAETVHIVQEYHLPVYHCLSAMLEDRFFG